MADTARYSAEHSGTSTSSAAYEKEAANAAPHDKAQEAYETERDVEIAPPNSQAQPSLQPDGADLEKAVTNKSTRLSLKKSNVPSVNDLKAIPNGGTKAWLQVLGAFFLFFNSWGIINTFGTYHDSSRLSQERI